ncbi:putative ATP-grasp-modified RiPP [Streptomyces seoulensis]|nr:putative ATP-grasp-modified RiPP [Streptomyces seoulensis]
MPPTLLKHKGRPVPYIAPWSNEYVPLPRLMAVAGMPRPPQGARRAPLPFARIPDSTGAARIPAHAYDHARQVNLSDDGGLLTCMANTHSPTVPDGSTTNPPPLDEGPKD